jgi:hypothetical protein
VLILHVAGFFCILITLLVLAEKAPSHQVWTTFYDPGWGNQGLSCLIGIVASTSCLLGADAAGKVCSYIFCRNRADLTVDQHIWPRSSKMRRIGYLASCYGLLLSMEA